MKWDQRLFNSLEMGGGETSVTWVGSSSTFSFFGLHGNQGSRVSRDQCH